MFHESPSQPIYFKQACYYAEAMALTFLDV